MSNFLKQPVFQKILNKCIGNNYNTSHSFKGNHVLPKIRTETDKKSIVYWDRISGKKFHRIWNQTIASV